MIDFINEIFAGPNLPATILILMMGLYWLLVIIGVVGMDVLDFDVDADVDIDMDGEVDVAMGDGIFTALLTFFHLGQVPVMVIVSFFALFFWLCTIITNHYLNPDLSLLTAGIWLLPCVLVGLAATKLAVMPVAKLFQSNTTPYAGRENLIGTRARVHSLELDDTFGEIVISQSGPPLVLNARNHSGQRLRKGDEVKIIRHEKDNDICIVELAKWESK